MLLKILEYLSKPDLNDTKKNFLNDDSMKSEIDSKTLVELNLKVEEIKSNKRGLEDLTSKINDQIRRSKF